MALFREASARENLQDDLNQIASKADAMLNDLSDEGRERLTGLRDRVSNLAAGVATAARDRLSSIDDSVRLGTRQAVRLADGYVQRRPYQAMGALAGLVAVGCLALGYFLSSRRYERE